MRLPGESRRNLLEAVPDRENPKAGNAGRTVKMAGSVLPGGPFPRRHGICCIRRSAFFFGPEEKRASALSERKNMETNTSEILKTILKYSTEEAMRMGNDYVGVEHVLLGMLRQEDNKAVEIMLRLGVEPKLLRQKIEEAVRPARRDFSEAEDKDRHLPVNGQLDRMLRLMQVECFRLKQDQVEPEHALLAILKNEASLAGSLLNAAGVTYDNVNAYVQASVAASSKLSPENSEEGIGMHEYGEDEDRSRMGNIPAGTDTVKAANAKSDTPVLDNFGRDLTKAARGQLLDPVVGREKELDRIIQILCRRKKNNPILIGDPGVGKSAIAEGLAQRIADKKVPRLLKDKRLMTLDIASVVAGTKYRGQFEERMKAIINELQKHPEVIIFIDEIHTIVGAGNTAGALDASNMFKPALARGEIQCIGATTLDEYRQSIEKDGALERRFQKVLVEATSPEETLEILHNIRSKYEDHHVVRYSEEALKACVDLTTRYVTDRVLPDKAIDALDEAGSKVHLRQNDVPQSLLELEAKSEATKKEMMEAIRQQEFERAARLRDEMGSLKEEVERLNREWVQESEENRPWVTEEDITEVVSMMSGVPLQKVAQDEKAQLLKMEEVLESQVIGQDEAIHKLVRAIRRNRTGLKDPSRPIGSFIFLGPTGVGKTYLTKILARYMFNSDSALIRVDMSEYMEKFDVSRLIGSPPGYVGYEDGGQLTEKVRRKPYSIVLFDEIEKAHPDIFNLLLQVLDDGQLTDGLGRKVDFKNTIIIMTSNLGSRQLREFGQGVGFQTAAKDAAREEMARSIIDKALKRHFAPEFLNRIDDVIVFNNLGKSDIFKIIDIELRKLRERLDRMDMGLELTEKAKEFLMEKGWDPDLGARPLRRCIEHYVEDELAERMVKGEFHEGDTLNVDADGDLKVLTFTVVPKAEEAQALPGTDTL